VGAAVERLQALTRSAELGQDAVYWYRGTVGCSEAIERDRVERALASLGAKRVVVGHTPVSTTRVVSRFEGMVLRVDTGMQQRGGRASALVLEGGTAHALYVGQASAEPIMEQPRFVGPRASPYDDARLAEVLASAPIVARTKRDDGRVQLKLTGAGGEINALFDPARGKRGSRFVPTVAAYRLDEQLGFDLVPVAVEREIDGATGAVYLDPSSLPDETARIGARSGADAWCPLADQFASMSVFDALAGSVGRLPADLRYSPGSWQLSLADNRRLFSTAPVIGGYLRSQPLEVSPRLRERLQALDSAAATAALGDVLDGKRIQAVLARRDLLLALGGK